MESRTRPVLDARGQLLYLVQIGCDITAQKALELALRERAEELARANAELARGAPEG